MKTKIASLVLLAAVAATTQGCMVAESKYLKKVEESDKVSKDLADLAKRHDQLTADNKGLQETLDRLKQDLESTTKERERLAADNRELEKVLKAKSDSLSKSVSDLRQKVSELEGANAALRKEIDTLRQAREEKVKEVSRTYEDLLKKMENEIAKGQVTISELKGKLTVNMVDAVLFDSGKAEVKPEGLAVLQKVVEILKNVKDKQIRIEGHTDNIPIAGALAKKYPTNWELSAARAVNVTRFLQQQGIDPAWMAAVGYGEFHPVAGNDSEEGKAKNRRIEIILAAKE